MKANRFFSPFYSECWIPAGRLDVHFFNLLDARELRACCDVVFESLDGFERPFGMDFDATVREVAHVSDNLMTRGDALREEAKTDALNFAAD